MVRLAALAALALLGACNNPCQEMCVEMAKYADECGYTVNPDEVQACRDGYTGIGQEEFQACSQASDPKQLREWWDCDDLVENYTSVAE